MANCKHIDIKTNVIVGDEGDVEQTICASKTCNYILREEQLVERADGTTMRRARRVEAGSQPEEFEFKDKEGNLVPPEERLPSAQEMLALAIKTREDTIGKQARLLAKTILDECAEHVLEGEYTHCIKEDEVPGDIVTLAVKELKGQGYRVKRTPEPGVGTWVHVKWPTKVRKKKKGVEPEIEIGRGKGSPQRRPERRSAATDLEIQSKQSAAAAHRQTALKARSKPPQ